MKQRKKIIVIGAGFSGLAAAAVLAKEGHEVRILEKNGQAGGRARTWEQDGFRFDMGPSWYWMPEVFEQFFARFGKKVSDFYELKRLDPSYRVYFGANEDYVDVPAEMEALEALFEKLEPGSSPKLREFLAQASYKYKVGMEDFVFRPSHSIREYLDLGLVKESFRIQLFQSMSKHVRQYFKHPKLINILEFPVLFLGAKPSNTPALYSLMNHADLKLGTWYPIGGMHKIVEAMVAIAEEQGVEIILNEEVERIEVFQNKANRVHASTGNYKADMVLASSDYQHTDQHLVDRPYQNYRPGYWEKRTMSPSSLLFYLGVNKRLAHLLHHNLFFDTDFDIHAKEIYTDPKWPSAPLFYASMTTHTDPQGAPDGMENLFLLMPLAPGLYDSDEQREAYFEILMNRLEKLTGQSIRPHIILKRSYAMRDFEKDYHSYKGNAYGLANTLRQTAFLKPRMRSKKVKNLFFAGQLTVPGPGVPPALISGQVAAAEILKNL